jgi:hypothetical protein
MVRNPGCTVTRVEEPGGAGDDLLRAEVARIVREALDGA